SGTSATNPNFGKIILAGSSNTSVSGVHIAACRLTATGLLDSGFDGDGLQTVNVPGTVSFANDVMVESTGLIVVAGQFTIPSSGPTQAGYLLVALSSKGKLATSFGTNGISQTLKRTTQPLTEATCIIEGFAQRLIVGGNRGIEAFSPDGKVDKDF